MAIISFIGSIKNWVFRKKDPGELGPRAQPIASFLTDWLKQWEDPAYALNPKAYQTLLRQDVVMQPMHKFAERMSGMNLTVVGKGKRRDELQKIVDATKGLGDALYWLSFAKIEGVRFMKLHAKFDERSNYYIPDFRGCGARKWKAGGNIYWQGWHGDQDDPKKSIGKLGETAVGNDPKDIADAVGQWYDRAEWIVFRPGAGPSPEGDTDIVLQLYLIAESAQLLDKALRIYQDRYSLPRELLKTMLDSLRPDELTTRLKSAAAKIKQSDARQRITMPTSEAIELLEPKGTTFQFLLDYRAMLERRVHKLIFGEDLTSGGQESGDRGGRESGDKQLFAALTSFGRKLTDAMTDDWLDWIEDINDKELPKLKVKEPTPYLELRPVVGKERLTVQEMVAIADRKIPMLADDVYATIGKDKPPGVPEVFKWEDVTPPGQEGSTPSNSGETEQRKDRKQDDSGDIDEDETKPQKKEEDDRNMDKDE